MTAVLAPEFAEEVSLPVPRKQSAGSQSEHHARYALSSHVLHVVMVTVWCAALTDPNLHAAVPRSR